MPTLDIDGVPVEFPHQPYACQIDYMRNLLLALKNGQNAILESPTGTGKTLCLICTSLAWLSSSANDCSKLFTSNIADPNIFRRSPPKIIFASRTHSQLTQAVAVFKQTAYSGRSISVIGSRDQLCLLPEVVSLESNSAKIFACRARVQTRTCEYFRNFDAKRDDIINTLKADGVADIEDLVKVGKVHSCCPYYMSRELKTGAEIVFTPYNYLLDPKIRRLYNIELENAAVIFDEAHNIEQVCEDAASVSLRSSTLASAIEYLRIVCEVVFNLTSQAASTDELAPDSDQVDNLTKFDISRSGEDKIASLNLEKLLVLKGQLIEFERLLDSLEVNQDGLTKTSEFLFELLGKAGLSPHTKDQAIQSIDEVLSVAPGAENLKLRRPKGINEVAEFLKSVFDSKHHTRLSALTNSVSMDFSRCYRVFVKDEKILDSKRHARDNVWDIREQSASNESGTDRTASYWCLSPGRAMQQLLKEEVRCVILTSGTLYPVEPLQLELRTPFPVQLQNSHVISPEQVRIAVIPKGRGGEVHNSSYTSREKLCYRESLGSTLIELARIVPNGFLIFFPSYAMLNQCLDTWKNSHIFNQFLQYKKVHIEPRDKVQFAKVFADYRRNATDTCGAILFAVMRGRASEGLDLTDVTGRGVAILGLPYPPMQDPRIRLKMAYLDEQAIAGNASAPESTKSYTSLTGRKWYATQAWRAVNQSIGRVIRHHRDFGAVFLCDERFASCVARSQLPHWMQSSVRVYSDLDSVVRETTEFYKNSLHKFLPSATREQNLNPSKRTPVPVLPLTDSGVSELLSSIPLATEIDSFAESLAPVSDLLGDYCVEGKCGSQLSSKPGTRSSIFEAINSGQSNGTSAPTLSVNSSYVVDDPLEARLLQPGAVKRIKLSSSTNLTPSGPNRPITPIEYVKAVKKHLTSEQTKPSKCSPIEQFKAAVKIYKASAAVGSDLENTDTSCVDVFYKEMKEIFKCSSSLLKDAICLLDEVHKPYYEKICADSICVEPKNLSELDSSASSASLPTVTCAKCHRTPALVPLISICQHVACFQCWHAIIEQGDRRCPVCSRLVRKRNLACLGKSKDTATE